MIKQTLGSSLACHVIPLHEFLKRVCRLLVMLRDRKIESPWHKHGIFHCAQYEVIYRRGAENAENAESSREVVNSDDGFLFLSAALCFLCASAVKGFLHV